MAGERASQIAGCPSDRKTGKRRRLVHHPFARAYKNIRKECLRNTSHQWLNHQSENGRNGAAECDELDLHVYASVSFLDATVTVEAPQESVIVPHGKLAFARSAGILDFRDPRRV